MQTIYQQANTDCPILINAEPWKLLVSDGPLTDANGKTACAIVNHERRTITVDRNTPRHLMPYATARAIAVATVGDIDTNPTPMPEVP